MAETFHGYIETTQDVLLIFEGCRRGLIPRVCRRLQEKERRMIRSGSVFVFDERESGIKRWTDGLVWSPSRILGNFLIYRELDKRVPGDKKLSISSASSSSNDSRQRSYSADQTGVPNDRNHERRLVGSLSDSYRFRKDGLIKKTMSIIVNGVAQHLISYYLPNDIISNKLRTPSSVPELASLEISPDLLVKQNFRIPPMVEPPFDHAEAGLTGASPVDNHNPYSTDDRRIHPFRSMSLGSLRASNNYQSHGSLSAAGRPDMNTNNLMYTTTPSSSLAQRMDIDDSNNPNKMNNNLSAYYGNQQYNNHGFPPLPSPSSMTSSPNTPMLSPVRQSFSSHPPRHYSMSSSSSGSIQRFNNSNSHRSSFDISNSIHPHIIPEVTYDQRSNSTKTENDSQDGAYSSASPNIGQLLNPVHPLNTTTTTTTTTTTSSSSSSILKRESNNNNEQLFQSMEISNTTSNYSDYNSSKLPSIPPQQQPQSNDYNNTYGGNCYIQRPQQQQPLTNTHSSSVTNNTVPMFRNGIVFPLQASSMYDDTQNGGGPELGMEPLMLK